MERLAKQKPLFIGLSCLSIGCLIGSFAYPLQKLELYRQTEKGQFDIQYVRTYLITENDLNYPYGFQKGRAKKFAQIHVDYKISKILLLAIAAGGAIAALSVGYETVLNDEIDQEVLTIKARGKKELLLEGVKHRLAMASKSQRLLFLDEMKALMEEFGSVEQEMLEADEINALYAEASDSKEEQSNTSEEAFRKHFPESMDNTSWKAVQKARENGASDEEIIKQVLECSEVAIGTAYIDFLKGKYL